MVINSREENKRMPTYEFNCNDCNTKFELFMSMSDNTLPRCPNCDSSKTRKLISSGSGIIFKGSGFYKTDYTGKKSDSTATGENAANGATGKSAEKIASASPAQTVDKPVAKPAEGQNK